MTLFRLLLTALLFATIPTVRAQVKAVTETGDEVLLADDGTWRYVEEIKNNDTIAANPIPFKKAASANFLLKSKITNAGVWLNSKQWNFVKSVGEASEYSFSLKENGSVGGQIIIESLGMDLKSLRKLALQNMQSASTQLKIVQEEMRQVNGLTVLLVHCDAVVQGIKINYLSYYYTDSVSTIQFMGYMAKNMLDKYRPSIEELLNGLVILGPSQQADAPVNKTRSQSSLVANSNCKALFTGNWSYTANGKKYIEYMEGDKLYETSEDKAFNTVWSINWTDKCTYVLRLLTSTDPAVKLIKAGAPITVEVLDMDTKKMTYQLTYSGGKKMGELTKEN